MDESQPLSNVEDDEEDKPGYAELTRASKAMDMDDIDGRASRDWLAVPDVAGGANVIGWKPLTWREELT